MKIYINNVIKLISIKIFVRTYVVWQFGVVYCVCGGVVMCRPGTQLVAREKAIGRL